MIEPRKKRRKTIKFLIKFPKNLISDFLFEKKVKITQNTRQNTFDKRINRMKKKCRNLKKIHVFPYFI